ncbi:MAG TPA: polysaccharide deacetylase family protein [Rhodocyclaceae bacterium]|nr:polysaccharide deacetylase family protein [Rhodocyclaceae bacterium]
MTTLLPPAKDLLYTAAKAGGFFPWARRRQRDSLCILCYHGFSFTDEHLFRPKLFLTPELFRQRIQYLKRSGYAALPLEEALARLRQGKLGEKELVITIDDGFHSVAALAAPILREAGYTATIYVTTYYVRRNNPIFRLAMQYLFWKTPLDAMDCTGLPPEDDATLPTRGAEGEALLWRFIDFGETRLGENGRMALAREVGRRLELDFDELVATRRLSLLTEEEIGDLARQGFDIQLHTHRHRLPEDSGEARRELRENRAVLRPLSRSPLAHLCYPSGVWSPALWPVLAAEGVATATTCEPGRNYASTPSLGLKRFLDFQTISPIVFEAEVSGFSEVLRRLARRS